MLFTFISKGEIVGGHIFYVLAYPLTKCTLVVIGQI